MSAPDPTVCTRPGRSQGPCLHAMAEGWITASDLCPGCMHRFMAALDAVDPDLKWGNFYRKRAAGDVPETWKRMAGQDEEWFRGQ